jgi:hypothetical protein
MTDVSVGPEVKKYQSIVCNSGLYRKWNKEGEQQTGNEK